MAKCTLSVHCDDTFMGSWIRMNSGSICKRDMYIPWNVPLSHGTVGCDGQSHCPMGLWDSQWDTHVSVEGQVDISWNVPLSHGTVEWDGQFTTFLDIYVSVKHLKKL